MGSNAPIHYVQLKFQNRGRMVALSILIKWVEYLAKWSTFGSKFWSLTELWFFGHKKNLSKTWSNQSVQTWTKKDQKIFFRIKTFLTDQIFFPLLASKHFGQSWSILRDIQVSSSDGLIVIIHFIEIVSKWQGEKLKVCN